MESILKDWLNSRRKNWRGKWKKKSKRMMIMTQMWSLEVKPRGRTQAKMMKIPRSWTREPRPPWNNSFKWTKMRKIFSGRDQGVILFRIWLSRRMMINMTPRILKIWELNRKVKLLTMYLIFRETTAMRSLNTSNSRENWRKGNKCLSKEKSLRKTLKGKMIPMQTKIKKLSSWAKSRWLMSLDRWLTKTLIAKFVI